jgi:inhibitor of the pro-sigma K processing machinery
MVDIVYIIIAVILIYFLAKLIRLPFELIYNGVIGLVALWLINFISLHLGIPELYLEINIISALVAGVFGVPGLVLLYIYKFFF